MPETRTIRFRKEDQWVNKYIQDIIDTKKKLGFKTSFSFELIRLAKNGLINSTDGSKIDRMVIDANSKKPL